MSEVDVVSLAAPFVVHANLHTLMVSVDTAGDGRGLVALQRHIRDRDGGVGVARGACGCDGDVG